jgi:beta-lysine 5,6-aminomutase alpha subunit
VLGEAIGLLERITGEPGRAPLLEAIADGTFGLMKRPADAGKGLDGVVARAPGYDNPATTLLETGESR